MDERGDPQAAPTLTTETPRRDRLPGQAGVVNGTIRVRKTHPNLYRMVMIHAVGYALLGVNFWVFTPTFLVYGMPNELWGSIFLALGLGGISFSNFYHSLRLLRLTMAAGVSYVLFFAAGTAQPVIEGTGSAQLPLLYLGMAILQLPLLLEPFINPWTARRD